MGQSRPLHYNLITIFHQYNIRSTIFPVFRNAVTLQADSEVPPHEYYYGSEGQPGRVLTIYFN